MSSPIRVLLADDHSVVREGIGLILSVEDDVDVVGQVADGAAAAARVARGGVDVVLMDIQMPGTDGIEGTRRIVDSGSETKVVILTTFERDDYLFDAIQAGASGFLLKNADPDHLVEAVRAAHHGHALLSPEVTLKVLRRAAGEASPAAGDASPAGAAPTGESAPTTAAQAGSPSSPFAAHPREDHGFTRREAEVLAELSKGLSNQEIADALYVSEATVKTHVSNVLAKLGARDRAQAIALAYRQGLVTG